jgi:hypothetical protein
MPPGLSLERLRSTSFNLTIKKVEKQHVPAIATARFVIPEPTAKNLCPEKPQDSVKSFLELVLILLKASKDIASRASFSS